MSTQAFRRHDFLYICSHLFLHGTAETGRAARRTGGENVYFCDTIEEVNAHAMERRCVAFEVREAVATEARVPETDGSSECQTGAFRRGVEEAGKRRNGWQEAERFPPSYI